MLNGYGTLIGALVPLTDPWYEDLTACAPYNPTDAKALLAAAGHATDLNLSFIYPNLYPANIAEYVVSQLKAVGITVTVTTVDFPTWLSQVFAADGPHDYDLIAVDHAEPHDLGNYANPKYYWAVRQPCRAEVDRRRQDRDRFCQVGRGPEEGRRADLAGFPRRLADLFPDISVAQKNIGYPVDNIDARFNASGIIAN